jgi:hypothetical protein
MRVPSREEQRCRHLIALTLYVVLLLVLAGSAEVPVRQVADDVMIGEDRSIESGVHEMFHSSNCVRSVRDAILVATFTALS